MSEALRTEILTDWCDELEDWPVDSVKAALRIWRRDNPSKKPNPGHIVQLLNKAWGEKHAPAVRAALADQRPKVDLQPLEHRLAVVDELSTRFPGIIKRIDPVTERASPDKIRADIDALNINPDE